jgi:hypothetical protein
MIRAFFHNIQSTIIENIQKSNLEINIAIAWFTNKEILGELTERLASGVKCIILVSDDAINKKINIENLLKNGGELKIIPSQQNKFLHEKFSIFDNRIVIMGSYNFTYNAEYNNHESILLTDDNQIIKQYSIRFKNLYNSALTFEKLHLISTLSEGIFESETKLEQREKELKEELINTLVECKKLKINLNYDGVYDLIEKYGAIGTPKRLISTGLDSIQSGFVKLWEFKRLDLTFEYIITKEKYRSLFDEKILSEAMKRLDKFK